MHSPAYQSPTPVDIFNDANLPDALAIQPYPFEFVDPYPKRLSDQKLLAKAMRAESEGWARRHYRDAKGGTWTETTFTNAMLRTMPCYASQIADDQRARYSPIAEMITSTHFTVLEIAIALPFMRPERLWADKEAYLKALWHSLIRARDTVIAVRSVIKSSPYLGGAINKIGWSGTSPTLKILCTNVLSYEEEQRFAGDLPSNCTHRSHTYRKKEFDRRFRRLVAADLPSDPTVRADFECLLVGIQLLSLHHVPLAVRSKFVIAEKSFTNLEGNPTIPISRGDQDDYKVEQSRIPANPQTGQLATHYTMPLPPKLKVSDIPDTWWIAFPSWTANAPPLRRFVRHWHLANDLPGVLRPIHDRARPMTHPTLPVAVFVCPPAP